MIFPVLKHPSSFHRLLVSRVKLVSPTCRSISKLSAINKGLRSGRDDAENKRGGRDRPRLSSQYGERSRPRSDAPRRPREGGFASRGGDRERPAFKSRDAVRVSSRDRPGRDSKPSYSGRNEGSGSGGRDRSRPAFKPGGRSSTRDRSGRNSGSSFPGRDTVEEPRPQGRLERLRKRETGGFAGQPGFSFDRKPGNEFTSHGRRDSISSSERGGFSPSTRGSRDSDSTRPRYDRSSRDSGRSEEGSFPSRGQHDGPRGSGAKFGRENGFAERRSRDEAYSASRREGPRRSDHEHERKSGFSERRQRDGFTSKTRDDRPRVQHGEAAPSEAYRPTVEEGMEPDSERANPPRKGLLRDIKSACKLIKTIQKAETSGEDTTEMTNMTNALLRSVNVHVTSGDFEDDPSEAVASLFQKKASEGTFYVNRDAASGSRSILYQKADGKIELAAKWKDGFDEDARQDKNEKSSRSEDGNRSNSPKTSKPSDSDDSIPLSVPYTTAASEFLYGSNPVLAALRGKRRNLYQLYIHPKIFSHESPPDQQKSRYAKPAHEFVALAKSAGIPFRNEFRTSLLDKMSDGRPHNGIVLEASKLPAPPILGLGKPNARQSIIPVTVAPQSAEDMAVNGNPDSISSTANTWRHPFVVMLDGIVDPGNVGNILRTAHFYGVDAVVVATNTCANLSSAVLAKASSGACEAVRILALPQPSNFVHDSAKAGWKIYAAVAPITSGRQTKPQLSTADIATASPLLNHPCILMLGAEGEGLRENLKNRANAFVSITRGGQQHEVPDVGVDSMNVSVAAGVLLESFLRKPDGAPEKRDVAGELGF